MKPFLYIILCVIITNEISAQGITKYGQSTTSSTNFVDKNGKVGSDSMLNKNGKVLNFPNCGTITDTCGNKYNTVTIGTQCWMKQNLKTTKYRNGDTIPNVTNYMTWTYLTTGAYCNYNNDTANVITYGRLYNWYAVNDNRNICPTGWHVSTEDEWTTLLTYLGFNAGSIKETGYSHWLSPNTGATNSSGFTALPGGYRASFPGTFLLIGELSVWWTYDAMALYLTDDANMVWSNSNRFWGLSVRCVKDY